MKSILFSSSHRQGERERERKRWTAPIDNFTHTHQYFQSAGKTFQSAQFYPLRMVKGNASSGRQLDRNMDLYRMRTPYGRPVSINQHSSRSVPVVKPKGSSCCQCCSSEQSTKVSDSSHSRSRASERTRSNEERKSKESSCTIL